jgi:hypothetical protein
MIHYLGWKVMERHMETKRSSSRKRVHISTKKIKRKGVKRREKEKKRKAKEIIKENNPRYPVLLDNCTLTHTFIF